MKNFKLNSAAFTSSDRVSNAKTVLNNKAKKNVQHKEDHPSGGFEEVKSQSCVKFEQSMVSIKKRVVILV